MLLLLHPLNMQYRPLSDDKRAVISFSYIFKIITKKKVGKLTKRPCFDMSLYLKFGTFFLKKEFITHNSYLSPQNCEKKSVLKSELYSEKLSDFCKITCNSEGEKDNCEL